MTTGPSGASAARDKGEAEQVLLDKALKDYQYLFTSWRLWVMDRNFPGAALTEANRNAILAGLARRRVQVDRHRHRDRKTKARPGFPAGGPRLITRTAPAEISVCQPLTA